MHELKVNDTLSQLIRMFHFVGLWQHDKESTFRKPWKKFFFAFFFVFFPIFLAVNAILCVDKSESILSVQLTVIASVIYLKCFYLLFRQEEILAFLFNPIVSQSTENRGDDLSNRKVEKFMKCIRVYIAMIFVTDILIIVIKFPFLSVGGKALPFFISFSWQNSEIIFWLAFVFVSLSILLSCTANMFVTLLWYIMLNYSIEYQLLGNKLKSLGWSKRNPGIGGTESEKSESTPFNSSFVVDLLALVKIHRTLNESVCRFKSCFFELFLAQINTSGAIICIAVYNLAYVSTDNIIQLEMHISILLYGIFDGFVVLYLANEITKASDNLSYCLFESNWIEQTESCKKYAMIVGEVLKQPLQLVILIYPMNLETFTSIIKGAYSMFNILKFIETQ